MKRVRIDPDGYLVIDIYDVGGENVLGSYDIRPDAIREDMLDQWLDQLRDKMWFTTSLEKEFVRVYSRQAVEKERE